MPEPAEGEWEASEKYSHAEVDYEHPSEGVDHCSGCEHYIHAMVPRCQHVKSPIRPKDWCERFEAK
jgi:hypothetical protein